MSYLYIETAHALSEFCHKISEQASWIAIDTEFVRTHTFYAELSLIQIQSEQGLAAIVDPIAIQDLSALWAVLGNPAIRKVFHSARQDIEILYQVAKQMPVSIFDTQIAALFLGHGDLAGLARVLDLELNIHLPKDQTRTNWNQRPLTAEQLEYAINDVRTLAPLYEKIIQTLSTSQQEALQEDFNAMLNPALYDDNIAEAGKRIKQAKKLPSKQRAISNALASWRESYAIQHNKPRKWTLADDCIVAIAKRPPKTAQALYKVPHIKSSSVQEFGAEWIALIDTIFANPDSWPEKPKKEAEPTPQEEVLLLIGQSMVQQIAIDYGINPHNIANKQQLLNCVQQNTIAPLIGWRKLLFLQPFQALLAEQPFQVKQGKLHLMVDDNHV